MGSMDFDTFCRCLLRCAEIAAEPGMRPSIVRVYDETLKTQAETFLVVHDALVKAEAEVKKTSIGAVSALFAFDSPYREARSMVRAYVPHAALPDTLQAQATDTDKVEAIRGLRSVLADHSGEEWADDLAQGAIGQQALVTITKVNEAMAAGSALAAARILRSNAYGPAYERFLKFKRLVRDALGSKSRQYRRLNQRKAPPVEKDTAEKATPVQVEQVAAPVAAPVEPAPQSTTQRGPVSAPSSAAQPA